jgi:hypothetical protein
MLYAPKPMHIPDGFLSVPVAVAMWLISIIVIAYALKRASKDLGERQVPLMGVLAALYPRLPGAELRGRRRHIGPYGGRDLGSHPARLAPGAD